MPACGQEPCLSGVLHKVCGACKHSTQNFLLGHGCSTMRDERLSEHLYLPGSMWILLMEGEEAGQAAANLAWYFCKGSIGIKWYM
ncbi:hypothetical protein OJAV_G00062380 [Oryzias javanicus]|uniref:Uncharacterized protein n=1 Tax=Oryzias javanicus TaxID=123683 RepID=A0A3S2PLZ9_ORYJA|nr:hypothetical protein OJAV_G00062380 [Oryzias javanicus]